MLVYVGTYTRGKSEGIYVYDLNAATGALEYRSKAAGVINPSYLALGPRQRYLYAVNEIEEFEGHPGGAVSAFAIDGATGALKFLNQQGTHGTGPCYVIVDATGRFVLVANYGGGSVCMLPVREDGSLGEATGFVQHEGSSVNPRRQEGPHAHSIVIDPGNRFAFAPDLGLDRVLSYRLDLAEGKLRPNDPPWAPVKAGAGPRHLAFHPGGRHAYLINELDSTLTVFAYDGERGALSELHSVSTLPAGFEGRSSCADVHVHPSGRFIYGSNRGHDSIAILAIDETTGRVTPLGHEPTQGQTPRGFVIDPTGTFLLAANQNTETIVTFRLDAETGRLQPTGNVTEAPTPVCLKIRP